MVAFLFFRDNWKKAFLIMSSTILVDFDHLLATQIYDPMRCSIGFHPLHGFIPIGIYVLLSYYPKTKYVGIGLVIHMILDSIDCQLTNGIWFQ